MDLKSYLACILSFVICLWQNESVNSMECEIGDFTQKTTTDSKCFPSSEINHPLKGLCQFLSCKQNETVEWKILDENKGRLQVQFHGPPTHCDFEDFVVELEIYDEKSPYKEALTCDTGSSSWKIHSKRTVEHTHCSNCSAESTEVCLQVHTVHFNYVYPGYYRLKITPYVKGSTRQAQRSYRMDINSTVTKFVKKRFTDLHLNASLQYRSASQELDLGIPLLIDDPPETMKIEVKFSPDYIDLYEIIKYGIKDSTTIRCEGKEKTLWPACQANKAGLECKFHNMTQGFYSVFVSFNDDRCVRGTVWAGDSIDPCFWVIKKEFISDEIINDMISPQVESETTQILFTVILIAVLMGIVLAYCLTMKISKRRRELGIFGKASDTSSKGNGEQTYNFTSNRFNFGQLLTLTERPRPEVLLLYTRESAPFVELVACFRRIVQKVYKCQVYDYYDPDLWNDVSEDPKGWVQALIVERQAKVIIIASEGAAMHQHFMESDQTPSSVTNHPFDHLFLFALRLIRDTADDDSYKNHFIVRFDGLTEISHHLEYLNPYTRFTLPKHLNKLFEHLHDTESTVHIDSARFEERSEVRQLRLQLEHMINLKLLRKGGQGIGPVKKCEW